MATKQKKNQQKEQASQTEHTLPKPEISPWRTPTGVAALLGAVAALITALVAGIQLLQSTTQPTQKSIGNCDQYFVGNVVETQLGIPDQVVINDSELIIVKIRQNNELIGSIKIIADVSDEPIFFVGDGNCVQLLGATKFEFNTWNKIKIAEHQIEFRYDDLTKTLSIR